MTPEEKNRLYALRKASRSYTEIATLRRKSSTADGNWMQVGAVQFIKNLFSQEGTDFSPLMAKSQMAVLGYSPIHTYGPVIRLWPDRGPKFFHSIFVKTAS